MDNITLDKKSFSVLQFIYDYPYVVYEDLRQHFSNLPDIATIVENLECHRLISFRFASSAEADEGYESYIYDNPYLLSLTAGNAIIENEAKRIEEFDKQVQPLCDIAESAKTQADLALKEAEKANDTSLRAKLKANRSFILSIMSILVTLLINADKIVHNVQKILSYLHTLIG